MIKKGILIFNQSGSDLSLISALLEAKDCTVFFTSLPLEAIHILKNNDIDVVLASADIKGMEGKEFKDLVENIRPGVSTFLLPSCPKSSISSAESVPACTVNLNDFVQFIQNHIRTENFAIAESAMFKEFFFSFTHRLLQLFEVKDNYFFNNDQMVADLSREIAKKMNLEEKLIDAIHLGALLKDIGKIGIQHEILSECRRLETDDLNLIKCHPVNTVQLLKQVNFPWDVESIIRHHHEHYDGNGYPDGLKGRQIPLGSRIIAVADSYVAMTMDRPYRNALSNEDATREIMKKAGSQFDPEVAEIFISVLRQENPLKTTKRQILLLNCDKVLSAVIKLNLNSNEFNFYIATDVDDALKYIEKRVPHLVIVDTDTLTGDNVDSYSIIRRSNPVEEIPLLVLLSGNEQPENSDDPLLDFIQKPIDMDLLYAKIGSLLRKDVKKVRVFPHDTELKGIAGNLEDMGLTDIIQLLNMGLKTARISLSKENQKGEIFLKNGKIVNVGLGELKGQDAFFELVGWDKGIFRIFHGQVTDVININMDTMNLLLEASRALDERRYLAEKK
jgi:HD-GYP domain-containing protein (c-di-GMP phosphodiesterase class II)/DNA-binding response OmpR family regulator